MSEFKPVLLALPTLTPSLAVEVLPHGFTLHRIIVQAGGRTHDIVIGPELPEDHVSQKYTNTIVGRYANRIPVRTHLLERHGIRSEFTAVANENPQVSLHGGPTGFDALPWNLLTPATPPTLFSTSELAHLSSPSSTYAIFHLISPDGDQGYPGKLVVEALVALIGPGEQEALHEVPDAYSSNAPEYDLGSIVLVYRAKLDEDGKKVVTPVNLTQHWGFNLDASLREGELPSIRDHTLTIKSDRIAELGPDSLATGSFLLASDHPSHAHSAKRIGDLFPDKSYDDFYYLKNESANGIPTRIPLSSFKSDFDLIRDILQPSNSPPRGVRPEPVVELSAGKSGIKLLFESNQHGVMFYANGLAKASSGARKKIHGGSGIIGHDDSYGPGTAAFLEFHEPLAAFLDPKNKDGQDSLLTTDELYINYVRCDVRIKVAQSQTWNLSKIIG